MYFKLILLSYLCFLLVEDTSSVENRTFPETFKFGSATASYQVEGGWNADGKGENIWDHLTHANPDYIVNHYNADVACDSYHKYKEDVALLKELGVAFYRFSISWARIVPQGIAGSPINQAGLDYYRNLIQELLDNDIEPLITIYHWDLPETLQEIGGWPNIEIIEHYSYYVRILFENYGDVVKLWLTFNEPKQTCLFGYGTAENAPAFTSIGIAVYRCTHTLLKAHAAAYHIYQDEFKEEQGGRVGMVIDTNWFEPATETEEDQLAAERALQFTYGWFANPIVHGSYPQVMIDRIDARSEAQGYTISRLPKFTDADVEFITGTYDFIALNIYSSVEVSWRNETDFSDIGFWSDLNVYQRDVDGPYGIRSMVNWLKDTYDNPEIFITENGYGRARGLDDQDRIEYYSNWLSSLLEAILNDEVNVTRYTAWSLIDVFEWRAGYSVTLGLYEVDFEDPERTRTAKASAAWYANVIATRCLVDTCEA